MSAQATSRFLLIVMWIVTVLVAAMLFLKGWQVHVMRAHRLVEIRDNSVPSRQRTIDLSAGESVPKDSEVLEDHSTPTKLPASLFEGFWFRFDDHVFWAMLTGFTLTFCIRRSIGKSGKSEEFARAFKWRASDWIWCTLLVAIYSSIAIMMNWNTNSEITGTLFCSSPYFDVLICQWAEGFLTLLFICLAYIVSTIGHQYARWLRKMFLEGKADPDLLLAAQNLANGIIFSTLGMWAGYFCCFALFATFAPRLRAPVWHMSQPGAVALVGIAYYLPYFTVLAKFMPPLGDVHYRISRPKSQWAFFGERGLPRVCFYVVDESDSGSNSESSSERDSTKDF